MRTVSSLFGGFTGEAELDADLVLAQHFEHGRVESNALQTDVSRAQAADLWDTDSASRGRTALTETPYLVPGEPDSPEQRFAIPEELALKTFVARRALDFRGDELPLRKTRDRSRELFVGKQKAVEAHKESIFRTGQYRRSVATRGMLTCESTPARPASARGKSRSLRRREMHVSNLRRSESSRTALTLFSSFELHFERFSAYVGDMQADEAMLAGFHAAQAVLEPAVDRRTSLAEADDAGRACVTAYRAFAALEMRDAQRVGDQGLMDGQEHIACETASPDFASTVADAASTIAVLDLYRARHAAVVAIRSARAEVEEGKSHTSQSCHGTRPRACGSGQLRCPFLDRRTT